MQAQRHAPGLKVTVYDGLAKKVADKDADDSPGTKKKKRRSFKKMSREERFKTSAVRDVMEHLGGAIITHDARSILQQLSAAFKGMTHVGDPMMWVTSVSSNSRCSACPHHALASEAKD